MKFTAVTVLASMLGIGAIAGGTVAVMQRSQPNTPAPLEHNVQPPASTTPPPQKEIAIVPKPEAPQAETPRHKTRPISTNKPNPKAQRIVERCRVLMAIVKDNNPPLNVRAQPNTQAAIVGQLQDGTFVSVKQEADGWFQIAEPSGWIATSKTASRCGEKTEVVSFSAGESGTTISDEMLGTGSHRYKFQLGKGQTLTVRGHTGPMPALVGPDGKHLIGMDQQSPTWSKELSSSGEYTLEMESNFRGYKYDFEVEVK
jgi:hypothetical protein